MTKRKFFTNLCLSLFFISNIFGQKFTDEGNQWTTYTYTFMGIVSSTQKIEGDSIVNGITYKKLLRTLDNPIDNNWNQSSLVREDSTQKIYLKDSGNEEKLIYDFSLELGDTIYSNEDPMNFAIVEVIDSIILNDGTKRKRLKLIPENQAINFTEEYWIEGIGGENLAFYFIDPLWVTDLNRTLQCFSSNSNLLFGPKIGTSCFLETSNKNLTNIDFKIFPIPVQNLLFLDYAEKLKIKEFKLWNIQGQLLEIIQPEQLFKQIDVSSFPSGTFVLEVINEDGFSFSKRFIKMK